MAEISLRIDDSNQLELLSKRVGYNMALRHFRATQGFASSVEDGYNLADILNEALREGDIEIHQFRPMLKLLLREKFGYAFKAFNLREPVENVDALRNAVASWTSIQVILVLVNADGEEVILNPEKSKGWEEVLPLTRDSLVVCYAGDLAEKQRPNIQLSAVEDVVQILMGKSSKKKAAYQSVKGQKLFPLEKKKVSFSSAGGQWASKSSWSSSSSNTTSEEAPVVVANDNQSSGKDTSLIATGAVTGAVTNKISVIVTNELFHNGNVESWKRVIASYLFKYPDLDVLVWYDGERINDINALFKWGKVKHGTPIMFSIAGDNPSEISKLRKYLFEGASPRFEAFLHGAPGTILTLF